MDPKAIIEALQSELDPYAKQGIVAGLKSVAMHRDPDVVIGGAQQPYMLRWWLMPRRRYEFNIYLHKFVRSDDDRALHDHPADNCSLILEGEYMEHLLSGEVLHRRAGDVVFRNAADAHRIELLRDETQFVVTSHGRAPMKDALRPVWSLFVTGPKVRDWGFLCKRGWIPWQEFTGQSEDNGPVRVATAHQGCGEDDAYPDA